MFSLIKILLIFSLLWLSLLVALLAPDKDTWGVRDLLSHDNTRRSRGHLRDRNGRESFGNSRGNSGLHHNGLRGPNTAATAGRAISGPMVSRTTFLAFAIKFAIRCLVTHCFTNLAKRLHATIPHPSPVDINHNLSEDGPEHGNCQNTWASKEVRPPREVLMFTRDDLAVMAKFFTQKGVITLRWEMMNVYQRVRPIRGSDTTLDIVEHHGRPQRNPNACPKGPNPTIHRKWMGDQNVNKTTRSKKRREKPAKRNQQILVIHKQK